MNFIKYEHFIIHRFLSYVRAQCSSSLCRALDSATLLSPLPSWCPHFPVLLSIVPVVTQSFIIRMFPLCNTLTVIVPAFQSISPVLLGGQLKGWRHNRYTTPYPSLHMCSLIRIVISRKGFGTHRAKRSKEESKPTCISPRNMKACHIFRTTHMQSVAEIGTPRRAAEIRCMNSRAHSSKTAEMAHK
jgi:hypothetical protein